MAFTKNRTLWTQYPDVSSGTVDAADLNNWDAGISAAHAMLPADYVIYMSGGVCYAKSPLGTDYSGSDPAAVLQSVITASSTLGATIVLRGALTWGSVPTVPAGLLAKLVIRGTGSTIVTLSTAGPRFLDFNRTADYQTFQLVELSDFVVDCNMVAGTGTSHVLIGTAINGFGATAKRVNLQDITVRRVKAINVPTDPSATTHRMGIALVSYHPGAGEATQTVVQRILIDEFQMDSCGNTGVLISGESAAATCNVLIDDVTLDRPRLSTFLATTVGSQTFGTTLILQDASGAGRVGFTPSGSVLVGAASTATTVTYTGITDNGNGTFTLTGCSGGSGTVASGIPVGFPVVSNIHLVSKGIGGVITVRDAALANSGDNNLEINNASKALVDNCVAENGTNWGFYYRQMQAPAYPNGQDIEFRSCRYRQTYGYKAASAFGGDNLTTVAVTGRLLFNKCRSYHAADPAGQAIGYGLHIHAMPVAKLVVRDFDAFATFSGSSTGFSFITPTLVYINTAFVSTVFPRQRVILEGLDLHWDGAISNVTTAGNNMTMLSVNGNNVQLSATDVRFHWNLSYGAGHVVPFCILGAPTGSQSQIAGSLRRFAVEFSGNVPAGQIVIQTQAFGGTQGLTLDASHQLTIEDCDFSRLPANAIGTELSIASAHQPYVAITGRNLWATGAPKAAAAITPTGSPFVYQNLDGLSERVAVQGGTVSKIELSVDGAAWTDLGTVGGTVYLAPAESLRVTYTAAPTMTKVPVS